MDEQTQPDELKRATFRYERWRAISSGIVETAGTTFLLLIAVRHFEAGAISKGIIATGGMAGLLLTPLVVNWVCRIGIPMARATAGLHVFSGVSFGVAALLPFLPVFVIATVFGLVALTMSIPLLTQIYHDNYPARERGTLFSKTVAVRVATAAAFSYVAGEALSMRLDQYQWLLLVFAAANFFSAYCFSRYPSNAICTPVSRHPLDALRFLQTDKVFRNTLISWMLMGFGNLMMLPLRVEYLANPRYGLALGTTAIAILTGVLPNLSRLVMIRVWGVLFDRMNFFLLRILVNLSFVIAILTFFTGSQFWALSIGALIFGLATAGGDIAWSLWVTKVAPAGRVADYMSVHTFFAGIRGLIAPFVAFQLALRFRLEAVALFSGSLILLAIFLLLPEVRLFARRKGTPLLEKGFD